MPRGERWEPFPSHAQAPLYSSPFILAAHPQAQYSQKHSRMSPSAQDQRRMVAQHGVKRGSKGPPIRYQAVAKCLDQVAERAAELGASVHMPRIGCGLAGGNWSRVEPLIVEALCRRGIPVTVYDWP